MSDPLLSVVVITENEADAVDDCLASVFRACRTVESFEVTLVDSASTDRTVERAREHPVTVVRIPEEHVVSCGAGRYVGDHFATGEYVLHVDGDMTLTDDWLPAALEYLREHDDVAAVDGWFDDPAADAVEVPHVRGVMLYDAAALREVGGFDPYLLGYEDVAVGFRLREAGSRLVRLPMRAADHRVGATLSEPLRRWRQGYYVAPGQAIRQSLDAPGVRRRLLARQRFKLGLVAWLLVGLAAARDRRTAAGWVAGSLAAFATVVAKRGPVDGVEFVVRKSLGVVGLAVGLARRTPPADDYPLDAVEVVQRGGVHAGAVTPDD